MVLQQIAAPLRARNQVGRNGGSNLCTAREYAAGRDGDGHIRVVRHGRDDDVGVHQRLSGGRLNGRVHLADGHITAGPVHLGDVLEDAIALAPGDDVPRGTAAAVGVIGHHLGFEQADVAVFNGHVVGSLKQ